MPAHILLISADAAFVTAAADSFDAGGNVCYTFEWVQRCSDGVDRLKHVRSDTPSQLAPIAAVMLELALPDAAGIAAFDQVFRTAGHIPVLVLSQASGEEIARQTVRRGAQDYLIKERMDSYSLRKALSCVIERAAVSRQENSENERARFTLNSIGDAVISTDVAGHVTYLNSVAERLTGWSQTDAIDRPLEEVFQPIDADTRLPATSFMAQAIRDDAILSLAPNCVLVRRDGSISAIEDSAAPIHDRSGRVIGGVTVFRDVGAARARTQHLSYLAEHDHLTNLPNRALVNDRLVQSLALARRNGDEMAVLYLDIDRFKEINDELGHGVGDQLLQSVARRLTLCVRRSDTVGRQGGDEFLVLLSAVTLAKGAEVIAQKILNSLSKPHHIGEHRLDVTASIGISTYPSNGILAESLVKNADSAMYEAKGMGGNRFQFFKSKHGAWAEDRRSSESAPRCATGAAVRVRANNR